MKKQMSDDEPISGPFSVRLSGNVGQEILDAEGRIICWTTDPWVAQVIVKLLNENERMIYPALSSDEGQNQRKEREHND